jgi:aminocarboxymuconate-semialdehyde decarboxylase
VIDAHHHWLPAELVDAMERYVPEGYRVDREADGLLQIYDQRGVLQMTVERARYCETAVQLADMDAGGIDVALLSASCFPSWITLDAARLLNDAAAELQRAHPTRFVAMAHVPPFGESSALEELERAARELSLRGVCITTNYRERYPDEDEYRPFLRKAAELDMPVFVHAAGTPVECQSLLKHDLYRSLGRSLDHALVAARLLYSGVLEELPGLRLVMPHLGGSFFVNTRRLLRESRVPSSAPPSARYTRLLDQLLFDTAPSFVYGPTELGVAVANLGVRRVALGSDYPVGGEPTMLADAVAHVRALGLPAADEARVLSGNAADFFALKALSRG